MYYTYVGTILLLSPPSCPIHPSVPSRFPQTLAEPAFPSNFYHVTPASVRWLWRHSVKAAAAHLRGPPFWCPFWCAFGASDAAAASGVPRNLCSHVIMVRTLPRGRWGIEATSIIVHREPNIAPSTIDIRITQRKRRRLNLLANLQSIILAAENRPKAHGTSSSFLSCPTVGKLHYHHPSWLHSQLCDIPPLKMRSLHLPKNGRP